MTIKLADVRNGFLGKDVVMFVEFISRVSVAIACLFVDKRVRIQRSIMKMG